MDPAASLQALEHKRKQLWAQLEALGDFCRGGISVNYRKCGKANCRCARPDHPGHGPQYLWNATIGGQSRVEVTEQICDLRPVEEPEEEALDQLKKKLRRKYSAKPRRR